jgi:zinc protease
MRSRARLFLIALALLLPAASSAAPTLVRTLPNKIALITREVRTRPIVCLQAWIRTGGRDESQSERGASIILAQQLFGATQKYAEGELEREVLSVGGTLSSEAGYGYTLYVISVPARFVDRAIDCMSEAIVRPKIDAKFLSEGIAKARRSVRGPLSSASGASLNAARSALWAGTPLAAPSAVPELEIANVPLTVLQRFHREHYTAEALVLVATGDVDSEDLAGRLSRAFAEMPHGPATSPRVLSPRPFDGPQVIVSKSPPEAADAAITVGFRGPVGGTADALALHALLALLVDSPASRFQRRLEQGATEYTGMEAARGFESEGGFFTVALRVPPPRLLDAESVLLGEIERLKSAPIADEEFDTAVRTVVAQDLFPEAELEGLGRATAIASLQGRIGSDEVYVERLKALRPSDLTAVARKYMDFSRSVFVEMGPDTVLQAVGAATEPERRLSEKRSIAEAAYRGGPSAPASSDGERRSRLDAPLSKIPVRPLESGRRFVSQQRLGGGMRLITGEDWSAPLATVAVYMLGGVRFETDASNGITALAREALMNCDDPAHPGSTYRQAITRLGRLVPYQDRDMWGYSVSSPSESLEETMRILGAMLAHTRVDTVSVDASRLALLNAFDQWKEDDDAQRQRLIFPTKYRTSGYRLPALGSRLNLASIPQSAIEEFYGKFIVRPNVVIAVFGAVRAESAKVWADRAFRGVPDRPFQPGVVAQEGDFTDEREQWELGAGPRSTVSIAFNGPRASSPDMPALYVVNSLLAGPRGWLKKWVLSQGVVASANSIVSQAIDESPIIASVETDGLAQEEPGVKLLLRQFKKVALLPLVGEELSGDFQDAKRHAIGTYLMLFTSNTARAFQWARAALFDLSPDYVLALPAKMDALGPDDLVSVGLKYFQKDDWNRHPLAICETRPGGW